MSADLKPKKIQNLKHYIPIYILGDSFVCGKCDLRTKVFDQLTNHFRSLHLQTFVREMQNFDQTVRDIRIKYQGILPQDGSDLTGYER